MSQEFYSYDVSTEYDDDQLHYHEDRHQEVPMGEASKDLKGLSSSAAKDRKKGFFSRLFSSKPKEKGSHTPSIIKQMSQKTPNKTATGKQRSQSAPRMKVSSWQEKTSTEHEKQQFRAMQQAARMERNVTPERRGSFDLEPYEDLGDVDVSPVSFYGSSFHQSMDDYHGPSLYDREVVVGGTKEPPPQPYYLQTYNQLMQQRNQQHQKFQQQKQHLQPPPFQQHQMHHNFAPQNAVRSTIQRSENNSGISTPTEENISRINSHEVSGDPGLEDPAVQAFMEKRRMKKERSREDKLMREMLQEAAFMGVSPSKLVASDVSTVEEKSTTYPGRPYPDASQFHHVAPIQQQQQQSRRPSQTGNCPNPPAGLMELASKSNDSYDRGLARSSDGPYAAHAQPKQRPLHPHEENQFYAPPQQHQHHHPHHQNPSSALLASRSNDSYDRPLPPPEALKSRPLPSQPVSPPLPVHDPVAPPVAPAPPVTTVPKATVALQQAPAPPVAAVTTAPMTAPVSAATSTGIPVQDLPPHPLHDFVGIPKGVQFDTLHVMHHENAEILKIAAALLQKARRHPQLPKTDGIPREVAAAQLATMWLNQATFVRRRAGPEGASSSGKVSSQGQGKPAMVPFPKAPLPRPADPAKARKDPSPTSKLPVNNANGGTTTSANGNGNAATTTSSGVPAAVASLTASPSAASPEQQRPAALPVETQVYQPQQQPPPPPHHPSAASQPLPLPPQHFGAPLRSTKEAPHQSAPNVAYERQPSPAQLPPSQASQQYQAPSTPPPPPLPLPSQPAAVSTIISHYEYLARSGSRDYTPDGGGSPYLTPSALHDSPPGGQRAGGRKIMRVPVADDPVHQQPPQQQQQQPQRRPSPMGMMRPEYARERAGSEGRLYEDVSRPGMMSRQTSTNNAPPPLLQQMSKRGYTQQQQQQQQMQHSYDAYDAPPTQYQQQQQQQPQYPVATGRGYDSYDVYDDEDEFAAAMAVPPLSSSSRNVSTSNAPSGYYAGGYSNGAMNNGGAHPALHHHASSLSATSHMASTVVTANGSWVCKYCTLINDTTHSRCSACEAPRSKGPLIV